MKGMNIFWRIAHIVIILVICIISYETVIRLPRKIGNTGYYHTWNEEINYKDPDPLVGMTEPNGLEPVSAAKVYYNDDYLLLFDIRYKWYCILDVPKPGEAFLLHIHRPYLDEESLHAAIDSLGIDCAELKLSGTFPSVLNSISSLEKSEIDDAIKVFLE